MGDWFIGWNYRSASKVFAVPASSRVGSLKSRSSPQFYVVILRSHSDQADPGMGSQQLRSMATSSNMGKNDHGLQGTENAWTRSVSPFSNNNVCSGLGTCDGSRWGSVFRLQSVIILMTRNLHNPVLSPFMPHHFLQYSRNSYPPLTFSSFFGQSARSPFRQV